MTRQPQGLALGAGIDRPEPVENLGRRRILFAIPALALTGLGAFLAWGLRQNPRNLPSALIGKPVPRFNLPPVKGRKLGLSSADLVGEVSLVNVFASWCVACRAEHPLFMQLAADKTVPVHGLNYKDAPDDAARWLNTLGDPYTRTGADRDGRVAIDWGVYGVPETYVIDADGRIAYRHIGPLTQQDLGETVLPLVARLRRQAKEEQRR